MAYPIVEQIAQNIKTTLETIATSGGYGTTIDGVDRPTRAGVRPTDKRITIEQGDRRRVENEAISTEEWEQVFWLTCWRRPSDSDATPIDQLLNIMEADITKRLYVDRTRGSLAIDSWMEAVEMVTSADATHDGARLHYVVNYRHDEDSPYTAVGG